MSRDIVLDSTVGLLVLESMVALLAVLYTNENAYDKGVRAAAQQDAPVHVEQVCNKGGMVFKIGDSTNKYFARSLDPVTADTFKPQSVSNFFGRVGSISQWRGE